MTLNYNRVSAIQTSDWIFIPAALSKLTIQHQLSRAACWERPAQPLMFKPRDSSTLAGLHGHGERGSHGTKTTKTQATWRDSCVATSCNRCSFHVQTHGSHLSAYDQPLACGIIAWVMPTDRSQGRWVVTKHHANHSPAR